MARNKLSFVEGAYINRPPLFSDTNYSFRKIWSAVVNGYTIPTQVLDNKTIEKPYKFWSQEKIKKGEYDSKAMNIIHLINIKFIRFSYSFCDVYLTF